MDSDQWVLLPETDSATSGADSFCPVLSLTCWDICSSQISSSEGSWVQRNPKIHQRGKGFGIPALLTSVSPGTPYGIRQVCSRRPSRAGVVSVLNCCLFISRLNSRAVMVGEGKCEPTREKGLQRQPNSQQSIQLICQKARH